MKQSERWSLPGGFIRLDRDVDEEAAHILHTRTGLDNIFLKQFHLFGKQNRSNTSHIEPLIEQNVLPASSFQWFDQRFATIGYYALVEYASVTQPIADTTSDCIAWCPLPDIPSLILDHHQIIEHARVALKEELNFRPVGRNLLPDEFTMPELQSLYETILETSLDRRNFRRKILSLGILKDTGKKRLGAANKAPSLYTFDEVKYAEAVEKGFKSGFL
ncbi:MAG: NUDIX hydrolase [Saprospiraceae bacterium]